jgi:hypothetical protein
MNLYGFVGNSPINSTDRDGRITVRTVSAGITINGSFDVKWNFILDSPASGDGYIVQHVHYSDSITNGSGKNASTTDDYYELWEVKGKCHFGHPPKPAKPPGSDFDWMDNAWAIQHGSEAYFGGMRDQSGVIKFFLKSNKAINISDFTVGGVSGTFDKPSSGGLKSTRTRQPWFDTVPSDDNEATGNRDVKVTWKEWVNSQGWPLDKPNGDIKVVPPQ